MSSSIEWKLSGTHRCIERFVTEEEIPGAALAVSVDGGEVYQWSWGLASEDQVARPGTLWPLASVSKLYTAAAVMSLVERGYLNLAMPLSALLPEYAEDGRESIRLWHLLTHTSGLVYESPQMEQRLIEQWSLDAIVDEAVHHPRPFAPGAAFSYSDYGYALAARMAERAAGRHFSELVREHVLEPGGLSDTYFPPPDSEFDRLAIVRNPPAEGTEGAMYNSAYGRGLAHPAFGVVSTAADLVRFGNLCAPFTTQRLFSDATSHRMTTDQTGGKLMGNLIGMELMRPQQWGYGFMIRGGSVDAGFGELASDSAFGHLGASGCVLLVDPVHHITMAFVSNQHVRDKAGLFLGRLAVVMNTLLADLTRV